MAHTIRTARKRTGPLGRPNHALAPRTSGNKAGTSRAPPPPPKTIFVKESTEEDSDEDPEELPAEEDTVEGEQGASEGGADPVDGGHDPILDDVPPAHDPYNPYGNAGPEVGGREENVAENEGGSSVPHGGTRNYRRMYEESQARNYFLDYERHAADERHRRSDFERREDGRQYDRSYELLEAMIRAAYRANPNVTEDVIIQLVRDARDYGRGPRPPPPHP